MEELTKDEWMGAFCMGMFSGYFPSYRLVADSQKIEVYWCYKISIEKKNVELIERAGFFPYFKMGININYRDESGISKITFCPFFNWSSTVLNKLKQFGYTVAN